MGENFTSRVLRVVEGMIWRREVNLGAWLGGGKVGGPCPVLNSGFRPGIKIQTKLMTNINHHVDGTFRWAAMDRQRAELSYKVPRTLVGIDRNGTRYGTVRPPLQPLT